MLTKMHARGRRRGHKAKPDVLEWPQHRSGRARVVIEEPDRAMQWALGQLLGEAGYETAFCPGPEGLHGGRCPLVDRGECALAAGADVVISSLNLSKALNRDVVSALRQHMPDAPLVVEAPEPLVERNRDLLPRGYRLLPFPAT